MREVGLEVVSDSMGSIIGTWKVDGTDTFLDPVGTGSHIDAIPLAGRYDGTVGVLGAIAAVQGLKDAGFKPLRAIRVIMFSSEEPTRFGISCISSRAMAGKLSAEELKLLRDENGTTFLEAAHTAGYALTCSDEQQIVEKAGTLKFSAFVELHIEQGPELENNGTDIGVVTAIAAPAALQISFKGSGGHAGALLMDRRNDASLAAAELSLAVEKYVKGTDSRDTVGTVGKWNVQPNAINSVPREVILEIDIRDIDHKRRDQVLQEIIQEAKNISERRKVTLSTRVLSSDPPATADPSVVDAIISAAGQCNVSSTRMVSRAYHDALFMAQITKMGMIFIPCKGGKSHRPDEFASTKDIVQGVNVLAHTLAHLAGSQSQASKRTEL